MMETTREPATGPDSTATPPRRPSDEANGAIQVVSAPLTRARRDDVLRVVAAATTSDGVAPLSEHVLLHLRYDAAREAGQGRTAPEDQNLFTEHHGRAQFTAQDFLVLEAGHAVGYAYLDAAGPGGASGELVVDPARRRRGYGKALLAALAGHADEAPPRIWAHGDLPAARALARAAGLDRVRALWQMRRPLRDPLPDLSLPAGVRLRSFVPGRDEDEWLRLNARAFASHPEQGAWTRSDLDVREREDWFDPAGFFLAERDGRLAGFHWTKVHGGPERLGEVYVVGVDPAEQGTGLGRALTVAGLRYLRDDRGLAEVMLYVDETNRAAIRLYGSLGFERSTTDVMYG
ncbi:MAG TPA: mycothiol synthase [Streptosporangiaceae bacterium]|nr:mycothiol synthase [Streptosporangiaceae bacterium]